MKTTIQKKLVRSSMRVLVAAFLAVIAIVSGIQVATSSKSLESTTAQLRNAIEAKGRILVQNNSLALSGMVSDNAFLSVQELVSRTVSDDPDVVYGIYMDVDRKAWINATDIRQGDTLKSSAPVGPEILEDSTSIWAAAVTGVGFRETYANNRLSTIEFCSPVTVDGEVMGFIRYGIGANAMLQAIDQAKQANRMALFSILFVLVLLGSIAIFASYLAIRRQSTYISAPIVTLGRNAKTIAGGDYDKPVNVVSDDEVGELAHSFEEMRQMVKQYTDHLEDMVQEKMRQVRDILDNIDQGLLTVNFDGTINGEFSKSTALMLQAEHLEKSTIAQVLHLGQRESRDWIDWIELVRKRHGNMRWEKLEKISPVRELALLDEHGSQHILSFSYQKMFDKNGNLARLMVLIHDVTESRRIEQIVQEEQLKHENEVRTILGLVSNLPEVIHDFFQDLDIRTTQIEDNIKIMEADGLRARSEYPNILTPPVNQEIVANVFRDLHTIKGNAASYGFEALSRIAHHAEESLELLRPPIRERSLDTIATLKKLTEDLRQERRSIDQTSQLLRGGKDGLVVCIAERKVNYVQKLAETLMREAASPTMTMFEPLMKACSRLRRVSATKLTDKYAKMVERIADKLDKKVEFHCYPAETELDPCFFSPFNESIVHVLRNSVDHGIESPEERVQAGKQECGTIRMFVEEGEETIVLEISDDGKGLDPEVICQTALAKSLITEAQASSLTSQQKLELIYLPGLSTKSEVSDISGRGVGMDAVVKGIERIGGKIELTSEKGIGTLIRIELPNQPPTLT